MAKIPDFSKLTDKLDIHGIVKNVKSMIAPGMDIPESAKDNPLAYKLMEVTKGLQTLAELHTKQANEIAKLDSLVGSLYQDVVTIQEAMPNKTKASVKEATATNVDTEKDIGKK